MENQQGYPTPFSAEQMARQWPVLQRHLSHVEGDFTHLAGGILNDTVAGGQYSLLMGALQVAITNLEAKVADLDLNAAELRRQVDAAYPAGGTASAADLQNQVNELEDHVARLRGQLRAAESERDSALDRSNRSMASTTSAPTNSGAGHGSAPRSFVATPAVSAQMSGGVASASIPSRPLGNEPPVFIGDHPDHLVRQEEYTNWQLLCRMKLATDEVFYPTPARQIVYAAGKLQGKALTLVAKRVTAVMKDERDPRRPTEWVGGWTGLEDLFSALDSFFITTDIAASYRRLFATLTQGSSHFSDFLATFNRLADGFEAPDIQKVDGLRNKVCNALKDAVMTKTDRPAEDAYDAWVDLYRQLWNNIEERRASRAASAQLQIPPSTHPRNQPSAEGQPGGDPMDLSRIGVPRGPLPLEERERRMREGLCIYCGSNGHFLVNCDKKPKDRPAPRNSGNA